MTNLYRYALVCKLPAILELNSIIAIKVLWKFMEIADGSGNIYVTSGKRKEILKELNISSPSFSIALKKLQDASIVTGTSGDYKIDNSFYHIDSQNKVKYNLCPKDDK